MNTNLVHNLLNVLIALVGLVTTVMLATGCTTIVTGALECSQSWLSPTWASVAITAMAVLKGAINVLRDGISGLAKVQPPVVDKETLRRIQDEIDRAGA
ncbi:hypothetical protein [Shinella pollutisoli]|uniref:Holin n=1 Tax=Shinella pollutisoli TaxID=2250594 RepID=A0ABV7DIX2_9HYPH|nr:hypothetical protein [Shinella pollutisoli]